MMLEKGNLRVRTTYFLPMTKLISATSELVSMTLPSPTAVCTALFRKVLYHKAPDLHADLLTGKCTVEFQPVTCSK